MKIESTNHRNSFLKKKSYIYSSPNAPRNHQIVIGEKPLVPRELILFSHWRKKVELGERKRK
jgi:hypothetical protein